MSTQNLQNNKNCLSKRLLTAALMVFTLFTTPLVFAEGDYQQNVLINPSSSALLAEARGRVMIYDGLKDETVELALTKQYGRIQNMMFVRTQIVQENGEYETEDDDCD
ncbi:MAG: hypothetical protein KAI17_06400 [Thiotrichaceae bacterium]|nr:hypothetical protein [Thiotrichaceae bacterium]